MKQHTTQMFSFTFLICNLFNVMRLSYNLNVAAAAIYIFVNTGVVTNSFV